MGMGHDHDGLFTDEAARRVRVAEGFAAHDRADAADLRAALERAYARCAVLTQALALSRAEARRSADQARTADLRCTELRLALRYAADESARAMDMADDMAALVDVLTTEDGR